MEINGMSKKIQVIIFVVIVAAVAVFGLSRKKQNNQTPKTEVKQETQSQAKLEYVDPEKLPEKFPADFPIEQGAEMVNNYNYENESGYQATRSFYSKKSQNEVYINYKNYLEKNGWQLQINSNQKDSAYLFAKQNDKNVNITINKQPDLKSVLISINFIYVK